MFFALKTAGFVWQEKQQIQKDIESKQIEAKKPLATKPKTSKKA